MRLFKGLAHALLFGAKLPCPMWLALALMFTTAAGAAGIIDYAAGGFVSGSSTYGPTSATVNGAITATGATLSGLTASQCVQTNAQDVLTSTGAACHGATSVTAPITNSGTGQNPNIGLSTPLATTYGGTGLATATTGCFGYSGTAYGHTNCVDANGTGLSLTGTTLALSTPVSVANGGTGTGSPGNTFNSPITATGSWPSYTIGCSTCLTTAGGQSVTLNDNFGGAAAVAPLHTPVLTSNGFLAFPATAATSAGSSFATFGWTNGSSVQSEWELGSDSTGDLCLAAADTCTDFLDWTNIFHAAGLNISGSSLFTGLSSFNGSSVASQSGAPTTVYGSYYGIGNGTTNNIAILIGYQNSTAWGCASACATSNSAQLCWYAMGSNGPLSQCPFVDTSGVWNIGKIKITNNLNAGGNPITGVSKLTQQAANDIWGSCAMAASTSCTITWSYAPTYCSKPNPVGTTVISGVANISSTTITITAASSNSLTWDVNCS